MIDYRYEAEAWLDYESKRQRQKKQYHKKFIGSRGYSHFDATISLFDPEQVGKLQQQLSSEQFMAQWKFLPFVRKDQRNRRYRHKQRNYHPVQHHNQKKFTHIKSRHIMYASHHDACLLALSGFIFEKPYEKKLEEQNLIKNVIAYRSISGANNVTFAKHAFDFMQSNDNWACIFIDIHGFFDNVPHEKLRRAVEGVLDSKLDNVLSHIITNITSYRYVIEDEVIKELRKNKRPYFVPIGKKATRLSKVEDFNELINNRQFVRKNTKSYGFPQGSPISGLLANIFLLDFDGWLKTKLGKLSPSFYQRYSDDMLIICPINQAKALYDAIKHELASLGLKLSTNKTEVFVKKNGILSNSLAILEPNNASKRENVQYLGLEWDGKHIILRPSTVGRRLRPQNKLARKYWDYHRRAITKVGGKAIQKQFFRIRRTIKEKEE